MNNEKSHSVDVTEYTLDNLPEKWFVEMGSDIDKGRLGQELDDETYEFHFNFYGKIKDSTGNIDGLCDDNISFFKDCVNVTPPIQKRKR